MVCCHLFSGCEQNHRPRVFLQLVSLAFVSLDFCRIALSLHDAWVDRPHPQRIAAFRFTRIAAVLWTLLWYKMKTAA